MSWLRLILADRRTAIGLAILVGLIALAVLAPLLTSIDPNAQADILRTRYLAPMTQGPDGVRHWMGTDRFGRDILARIMFGARISLAVGLFSVAVSVVVGYTVGICAAVAGGSVERGLMAMTDAALAMPRIVLLLTIVALFEASLPLVILVLGFTGWMGIARLARAETKAVLAQPYLDAARAGGLPWLRITLHHLLPNTLTPVIVAATLAVGNAITLESGLSFLGIGVPPPAPSWGSMIASGRDALVHAPWISTFPGLAIVLAVIATNLLGDGLQEALDPTRRGQAKRSK